MRERKKVRTARVFTPGGFPTVTYVSLKENELEQKIGEARDYLSKLVVLKGAKKSGKTVLVDRVFPSSSNVWIDGGTVDSVEVFWDLALEKLGAFTDYTISDESSKADGFESGWDGSGGVGVVNGGIHSTTTENNQRINSTQYGRHVSSKAAVIEALQNSCNIA